MLGYAFKQLASFNRFHFGELPYAAGRDYVCKLRIQDDFFKAPPMASANANVAAASNVTCSVTSPLICSAWSPLLNWNTWLAIELASFSLGDHNIPNDLASTSTLIDLSNLARL